MTLRLALVTVVASMILPVATAQAVLPAGNVVRNGDAEAGQGAANDRDAPPVPEWEVIPNLTAVLYGTGAFPSTAESTRIGGGRNFFAGGPDNGFANVSIAQQRIDLSAAAPEIDAGGVHAILSADLGGFGSQEDMASVSALFTDPDEDAYYGGAGVGPVTAADRQNTTRLLRRSACTTIGPGARQVLVHMAMQRSAGSYNDGYADNVSIRLAQGPCPAGPPPPLPPPAPPQPKATANAEPVSGRILVRRPGSDEFQELNDARSIPVGSEVDATRGTVELQTAATTRGSTQSGRFQGGTFSVLQQGASRLTTELKLSAKLGRCRAGARREVEPTGRRRTRRLWGRARGRFRTRGRYASATVRGTRWFVQDTCTTTTVRVTEGSVRVRDFVKRKNRIVKAPGRYVARARKR